MAKGTTIKTLPESLQTDAPVFRGSLNLIQLQNAIKEKDGHK